MQRFSPKASSVLKKIFKGFYHIWAWRPSWSMDRNHFSNLSFPKTKEAPYEIWAKLAQGLRRISRLKMLTDGQTHGRTDDGRKVISIAYPEHSSGELKSSCAHYLFNHWLEFDQTSPDTSSGWGKEVNRFWWFWPYFQGHYNINTQKVSLVCTLLWTKRWNLTKLA